MTHVKIAVPLGIRSLTTDDVGRCVQSRCDFCIVAAIDGKLALMQFYNSCMFKFVPYQGQELVIFDGPVVFSPRLMSHHTDDIPTPYSLALFFDKTGGPFVVVDALEVSPKTPWQLFNLLTGEAFPLDSVPRQAFFHWCMDARDSTGPAIRLIDMTEEFRTRSLAVLNSNRLRR